MSTEEKLVADLLGGPNADALFIRRIRNEAASAISRLSAEVQALRADKARVDELLTAVVGDYDGLVKAGRHILPYLRWTIGDESPGHHPTMPSAVVAFEEAFGFDGKTSGERARAALNPETVNG